MGKQRLLGEGKFRVLDFSAGIVSSDAASQGMTENVLQQNGVDITESHRLGQY